MVRVALPTIDVGYFPVFLAQAKGIFKNEGLGVELIAMRGAKEGVQALVEGHVEFAMSIGPALPFFWRGEKLTVLVQMITTPVFSLIARPEINKVEDLRGKKIGVTFGGITEVLVHELFRRRGIDPEEGIYLNLPAGGPKIAALKDGTIAAALLPFPFYSKAIQAGLKEVVFLGNDERMQDLPFTGLIATSRYIQENPLTIMKMVKAIARAVDDTYSNHDAAIVVMQSHLGVTLDEAREIYRLIRKSFSSHLTEDGVKRMAAFVSKSTAIKLQDCTYTDLSFLHRALLELRIR